MASTTESILTVFQTHSVSAGLGVLVLLLGGLLWHHSRRIRRLEEKLVSQHRYFRQEMKMMNQSAIGVGHRVKHLEKRLRRQPVPAEARPAQSPASAFEQLLNTHIQPEATTSRRQPEPSRPRPERQTRTSRAEQALADWMRDMPTTA